MRIRKHTLTLAACFALLALPLAAGAQAGRATPNPGDILGNPRALARFLRLTPAQVETQTQLVADLRKTVEPLREAGKGLREAYRAALDATPQNACAIGDAAIDVYANREQIKAAYERFDDAFSAILTPQQLARYEALKEAARLLRGGGEEE